MKSLRLWLGGLLLFVGVALLVPALGPLPRREVRLPFQVAFEGEAAPPVQGHLTARWPRRLRQGEPGWLQLTLEGAVASPDVPASQPLRVEVQVEGIGWTAQPEGVISEALPPAQPLTWRWRLPAQRLGLHQGRLWVQLALVSPTGAALQRRAVAALPLEWQVVRPWGLSLPLARGLGLAGIVVGGLLLILPPPHSQE